jgi:hypothetical protein
VAEAEQFQVVSPLGQSASVPIQRFAPRSADLRGKRLAQAWNHLYRGDAMFELLERTLSARFPGLEWVRYEEFGNLHGADEAEVMAALPERLLAQGVDGLLTGVGS